MADKETERRGLRLTDLVLLIVLGVVGIVVAFWLLSFIAGIIWWFAKMAILVAVVGGVLYLLVSRRRH